MPKTTDAHNHFTIQYYTFLDHISCDVASPMTGNGKLSINGAIRHLDIVPKII